MSEVVLDKSNIHVLHSAPSADQPRWERPAITSTLVSKPYLSPKAMAYVQEVLESGWWGYGPVSKDLQSEVEKLYDLKQQALATSSCTAAMHLALRAFGVGPGDEVIVPAFTYVSTAIVATYCGAEPVFADVDPASLVITRETVEPLLTDRTKAIIAMHYAGPPADFDPIRDLVKDKNITVIEDAAHAFGSVRDGEPVGAKADFAAFSFAPTKQIASSNGGILLFKDAERRSEIDQLAFLGLAVDTFGRTVAKGVTALHAFGASDAKILQDLVFEIHPFFPFARDGRRGAELLLGRGVGLLHRRYVIAAAEVAVIEPRDPVVNARKDDSAVALDEHLDRRPLNLDV